MMFKKKDKVNTTEAECQRSLETISGAVADFDGEDKEYNEDKEICIMGYLVYIIIGVATEGIADEVLQWYGKENTDGSKLSVGLIIRRIQREYAEAKAISDAMMENEATLDEILTTFADRICRKCTWEKSENNMDRIKGALHSFYTSMQML